MRRLIPIAVALSLVLATAPPAGADETISTLARVSSVSAYGGRVAWSSFDPNLNTFVLMTRFGGTTGQVPVRPRTVPFDVDLGPNRAGQTVAVYSRCRNDPPRREPALGNVFTQLPAYAEGRGCDLYEFDFERNRESRLSGPNSSGASEFLPSIWKDRIAFTRVYEKKKGRDGKTPHLYSRAHIGSSTSLRLPGGTRATGLFCSGGKPRRCRAVVEPGPTAVDLAGKRLAVAWDSGEPEGATSTAYLETIGSHSAKKTLLLRVGSGNIQGSEIETPAIVDGQVYWTLALFGDVTENKLQRYRITTGELSEAPLPPPAEQATDAYRRGVFASAVSGPDFLYLASGLILPGEPCTPQAPCSVDPGCSDAEPCALKSTRDIAFKPTR
jgi:hypothetical protein